MSQSQRKFLVEVDPSDMSVRGRIGAAVTHSRHDSKEITAAGRKAFLGKFYDLVDPDGKLPPEERERRAAKARQAHFLRLSRLSALSRAAKKKATGPAVAEEGGR
jgi:hypothetical protein